MKTATTDKQRLAHARNQLQHLVNRRREMREHLAERSDEIRALRSYIQKMEKAIFITEETKNEKSQENETLIK